MSYSQHFVLSPRGDCIIYRDFRHDVSKSTVEIFFRNCKFWNGKNQEAPPVFVSRQHTHERERGSRRLRDQLLTCLSCCIAVQNMDGINYLYIKKNGLFFVFTTRDNVSPSLGLELLTRLTKLFKDYLGVTSTSTKQRRAGGRANMTSEQMSENQSTDWSACVVLCCVC